jgi:hypothetical protein
VPTATPLTAATIVLLERTRAGRKRSADGIEVVMIEHHRDLLHELTNVGLKPRLTRTNGDHVKIEWDMEGKVHSILSTHAQPKFKIGQVVRQHLCSVTFRDLARPVRDSVLAKCGDAFRNALMCAARHKSNRQRGHVGFPVRRGELREQPE